MKVVIKLAGQQFLISEGDQITINKKLDDKKKIKIEEVLLSIDPKSDKIELGKPTIKTVVEAEIVKTLKSKKVRVFKYKAKKGYRRNKSHRQDQTVLKITKIKKG